MEYTRHLAQFAAQLNYSDLPQPVVEKAKALALHTWAVQLAGSTLPWSKAVYRYTQAQGGAPQSSVVNYGLKTSAINAAFVNGTFGHGFEMDDNHAPTGTKGGCVMLPTCLAIGEMQGSSGRDLVLATVIGYEVMTRVGISVNPTLLSGAHHPTGSCAPFGAAAAAGKLLGLDATKMMHAISIAGGHSAGLGEAPASGRGDVKRIFGGMAAASGIRSALLAREGLTGPATMLEGKRGFCRAFGDLSKLPALTEGLGSEWQILKVHFKIYAQDGYIQPMTEALDRLVGKHGFKPDEIEEIRAGTNQHALDVVSLIREPKDLTSAQFSANFSLALFLVKGNAGFQEYTERNLADPRVLALSRRIQIELDPQIEDEWQKIRPRGARVSVRLKSGETFSEYVHNLRPMSESDLLDKVRRLATVVLDDRKTEALIRTVQHLEGLKNLSTLVPLLAPGQAKKGARRVAKGAKAAKKNVRRNAKPRRTRRQRRRT